MRLLASRVLAVASLVVALVAMPATASAQVGMFLRMTGVPGESTDQYNKGAMDVMAWSWGTTMPVPKGSGRIQPTACIQDLSVTKGIDLATPQLIMNNLTGQVAPEATLSMRRIGEASSVAFLTLKMTNVTVQSYQTGGDSNDTRITERVVLRFESLVGEYRQMDRVGHVSPPVTFTIGGSGCR